MSSAADAYVELDWRSSIRNSHLDQLRHLDIPEKQPFDLPKTVDKVAYKNALLQYIKTAKSEIDQCVQNQVYGGKPDITWNNTLITFLECAATYLRDLKELQKAADYVQKGDDVQASKHLESSDAAIREVANAMGLDYVTVCDLPGHSPKGHDMIAGPFCGAFSAPTSSSKPFIGIAFKGTKPDSWAQWWTDFRRRLIPIEGNIIPGAEVSKGVNWALLTEYKKPVSGIPQNFIKKAIQTYISKTSAKPIVHVTGHSLGGSFATLCYGALLASPAPLDQAKYTLGDIYTFGAPRISNDVFANQLNGLVKPPSTTWRIMNEFDPVPTVPPASYGLIVDKRDFYHIDTGYLINPTSDPVKAPSENGLKPGPEVVKIDRETFRLMGEYHVIKPYWKSLCHVTGVPYVDIPYKDDLEGVLSPGEEEVAEISES